MNSKKAFIIFDELKHTKGYNLKQNRKVGFIANPFTEEDKENFKTKRMANNIVAGEEGYKRHFFYAKVLAMLGLVEMKKSVA